jgi:hypothetical protein
MRIPVVLILILFLGFAFGGIAGLIVAAVILGVGYWVSLRLNPRTGHRSCKGTGRGYGRVYTWTHHRCLDCGGTGRVIRYGASRWGHQAVRDEAARRATAVAEAKRLRAWR